MKVKEIKEKVTQLFTKVKTMLAEEYEVGEGQVLLLDPGVEANATATINGEPAADGSYTLPDGRTCVVAGGVITEVQEAQEEQEEAMEAEEPIAALEKRVAALEGKYTAQEQFEEKFNKQGEELKKYKEANKELIKLVQELINEPAAESVEKQKGKFESSMRRTKPGSDIEARVKANIEKFS